MKRGKNGGERVGFPFSKLVKLFITAGILLVSNAYSDTVVLDFEQLATPGMGLSHIDTTYNEDGFSLSPDSARSLYYWHTDDENFAGSTALFTYAALGGPFYTRITREDGLSFDLDSIMLSEAEVYMSDVTLNLYGTRIDNSTVNVPVTLDGTFGFQTFYFDELTSLKELRLIQHNSFFQYDNVTFNVVPEPCTFALLSIGALILPRRK